VGFKLKPVVAEERIKNWKKIVILLEKRGNRNKEQLTYIT